MQLFKDTRGFVFAFGFDMTSRKVDPRKITFCEPGRTEWEWQNLDFDVAPQFVMEAIDGTVVAYQPGVCIEMRPTGDRVVVAFKVLKAN